MAPVPASIAAGRPVSVAPSATMADGIAVAAPGVLTTELMSRLCSRVLTVTEENLSRALLLCLERSKQLAEPAGAAGVAALLEHPAELFEPPVVVVLSGGNIDPLLLSKVLGTACPRLAGTWRSGASCRTGRARWRPCSASWPPSARTCWT